jgi:hypothetical protein
MRELNNLGAPRVMLGNRSSSSRMLHPEHTERERHFRALRPSDKRISIADNDFKRLFDKINLRHATPAFDSRSGKPIRAGVTCLPDERLMQINIAGAA